jgi:hypothetical protein
MATRPRFGGSCAIFPLVLLVLLAQSSAGFALELVSGDELRLRWDNTLKYSSAARLQKSSPTLLANLNGDDGNRNFDRGLVASRVDVLSELDLSYRIIGVRISAAGWYDLVYNLGTDNDSPGTVNSRSQPADRFTDATRTLHGRKAEVLDAFAFVSGAAAGVPMNLRLGRHTLLWGESLLIADNGIASAQAPVDAIKAVSVPASQAKELFMPVTQVSAQLGPVAHFSLAGFYQLEWRRTRLSAAGSYFSTSDVLDAGGERLLLAGGTALFRGEDLSARRLGQWGVSLRYGAAALDSDVALHFINYHDKAPQVYLRPGLGSDPAIGKTGEYLLAFQEDIRLLGASLATSLGAVAVAGEVHVRLGTPLASTGQSVPVDVAPDNQDNPLYAVGNTLHGQLSATYVFSPSLLWASASVAAEAAVQTRLKVSKNRAALDPKRDKTAVGLRVLFAPSYFQVLPNLDVSVPLALTYNPRGKSPIAGFNGGADRGGSASVGVSGEYRKLWLASVQLAAFFGDEAFQPRRDRAFVSFVIQRTF